MESGIESINENIIEEELIQEKKKVNKKLVVGLTVAGLIAITVLTTLLVGYFKFEWFQKKQDNVIQNIYHKGQVLLFNEVKTITTEMSTLEGKEVVDQKIRTDFLVMINSKKKLNYFGEIDNLYKASLVILKIGTEEKTDGLNHLDEKELENIVNNPDKFEYPIAKFSFYENGTLVDIYIAKDTNHFYASSMVEIIEEITPRISKKLYNIEQNGVEFSFDEDKDEIVEEHKEKEFTDKYSKIGFEGSKINKKITRKVSKDGINQVNIETQLDLISQKPENDEDFYDIGLDGYSIKINSDLKLIENKDDKELIKKIELILEKLDYEESQKLFEKLAEKEMENVKNTLEEVEKSNENDEADKKKLRNLLEKSFTLATINICGKSLSVKLVCNFGTSSTSFSLKASIGGSTFTLSSNSFTASYSRSGSKSLDLITIPFTLGPLPLKFTLSASANYNIGATFTISSSQKTVKLSGSIGGGLGGRISFDAKIASASLGVNAKLLTLSLTKTANLKNNTVSGSTSVTIGPITIYVQVTLGPKKWKKDLCSTSSYTKYI